MRALAIALLVCACNIPEKYLLEIDSQQTATLTIHGIGNGAGVVVSEPAGLDCGATCTLSLPIGSQVTITATPKMGSLFGGWSAPGCSGTGGCTLTLDADTDLDATFSLTRFAVALAPIGNGTGSVTSQPAGIDCGSTCSAEFDYGTQVMLTAAPGSLSTFLGWVGGSCLGVSTCTISTSAASTVKAAFGLDNSIVVSLTGTGAGGVTSSPAGINCPSGQCAAQFSPAASVTLTATPTGNSAFTGWTGAGCSGTGTCVVSAAQAHLVTANFTLNQHPLTVVLAGNGTGTVTSMPAGIDCPATSCNHIYDYGTMLTLTGTRMAGRFVGWSGGGCTGMAPCMITLTAPTTVTATFQLISITNVSSTKTNGTYPLGTSIAIQVTFTDPVVVTGTPTLALNSGGTATYTSGSGTNTLTFTYTVAAGNATADLDYTASTSLALAGGMITDASGVDATLTLPAPGAAGSLGANKAIAIDGVAPVVTSVTSTTANGQYKAGASISIQVNFSEAVTITGTPTLALNSGATVNYTSGSGTQTLTFSYTVAATENAADLEYANATALSNGGGTLVDAVGNNAVLTLPAVGGVGSLGNAKNIVVDTSVPTFNAAGSTAMGASTTSVTLNWTAATDNLTPQASIVYNIYWSTSYMGQSYASPQAVSAAGATTTTITGLALNTNYYFVIRPQDLAGNGDTNTQQIQGGTKLFSVHPRDSYYTGWKVTLIPGASVMVNSYVVNEQGPTTPVTLSLPGLPAGVTTTFGTNPVTPGSQSVTTYAAAANAGTTTATLSLTGTTAVATRTAQVIVEVIDPAPIVVGAYTWYHGSSGVSCNAVCANKNKTCVAAGLTAYANDSTCAVAKAFHPSLSCGDCGGTSKNLYCFAPGYVDDPSPGYGQTFAFYHSSVQFTCSDVPDPRARAICPCQ